MLNNLELIILLTIDETLGNKQIKEAGGSGGCEVTTRMPMKSWESRVQYKNLTSTWGKKLDVDRPRF